MRDTQNAPGSRIRGWGALLVVAAFAHASCALAQVYKCTAADGRTSFSDKPCPTSPGAAGSAATGKAGVKQEVLRQPPPVAAISADATSAMCARYVGSKATDATIQSLPEKQRETVIAALRGVMVGMAGGSGAQENLRRVTLHIDAARNAVICVPQQQRAQAPGAPPITTYTSHRIEPNGRMETQQAGAQPGAPPLVANDANEPATVLARCSSLVVSCVRPKASASAIDECFEKAAVCPGGRLDPALSCCPQACKDGYSRERSRGTNAENALIKVLFGDDAGAASCVPGIPKRE